MSNVGIVRTIGGGGSSGGITEVIIQDILGGSVGVTNTVDVLVSGITRPTDIAEASIGVFRDLVIHEFSPEIAMKATYGLLSDVETFSASGGTVTATSGGIFELASGTSVGGYGTIWTRNPVIYQPGIGCEGRITASFTTSPPALSTQLAGFFTAANGMFFGYNGISFGIMHRYGGNFETRRLTLTTGAGGAETVTVNLNGTPYTTTVSAGTTATNAGEIFTDLKLDPVADASWNIDYAENYLTFVFKGIGEKDSTYGISSTGTLVGSFSRQLAGNDPTEDWTYQDSWNDSPASWIDHSKANLFRYEYAFLGYGPLNFYVMHPDTEKWERVHHIIKANSSIVPNFSNPALRMGWATASLGSSGTNLVMRGGSAMAGTQGSRTSGKIFSNVGAKESVTEEVPVLTIRLRNEFRNRFNNTLAVPLFTTIATDSNRGAIFNYYFNATITGAEFYYENELNSAMMVDKAATAFEGGQQIGSFALGRYQQLYIETKQYNFKMRAGDQITITAQVTRGSAFGMDASFTWEEYT